MGCSGTLRVYRSVVGVVVVGVGAPEMNVEEGVVVDDLRHYVVFGHCLVVQPFICCAALVLIRDVHV